MMNVPVTFLCPLSHRLMEDPVITLYGDTYEKSILLEYINVYNICPLTMKPLHPHLLFPDKELKQSIEDWKSLCNFNPTPTNNPENKKKKKRLNSVTLSSQSIAPPSPKNNKKIFVSSSFSTSITSPLTTFKMHKKRSLSNPIKPACCDIAAIISATKANESSSDSNIIINNSNMNNNINTNVNNNNNINNVNNNNTNVNNNSFKSNDKLGRSSSDNIVVNNNNNNEESAFKSSLSVPPSQKFRTSLSPPNSFGNSTTFIINLNHNPVNNNNEINLIKVENEGQKSISPSSNSFRSPKQMYTSSSYGRSILSSTNSQQKILKSITPLAKWYRRGRSKWTSFNSIENEILEDSYKNRSTSDQVFRFGTKGIVNIPERTLTSDSGSTRQILRATWFCIIADMKLFPYSEGIADLLEHHYQTQLFNIPIIIDNRLQIVMKSPDDMKEYTIGNKDEFRTVVRGYQPEIAKRLKIKENKNIP